MKKLIFILLSFCFLVSLKSQTKYPLPYDTVIVMKPNGVGYLKGSKGIFADTLFLNNKLKFSTGTNSYVLTSDANGNISLQPASGGSTNNNIGAGSRLAVFGTNNIKTLFGNVTGNWDSLSNANGLTYKVDTNFIATRPRVQKGIDSLGALIGTKGSANSNIGAGDRLAVFATNNIKTLFTDATGHYDSVSNANGVTYKVDTVLMATRPRVQKGIDSLGKSVLDSTQLGYAPKKLLYGSIYSHNTWANLNAFTNVGAGTFTVVSSKINASGGASNFNQTLQVSTTDKGTNGNTNLRHWKGYIRAKVTATGNGFAVGIKSNTINGNYNLSARLVTSSGTSYIEGGLNSATLFATSAGNISLSVNDYVEISIEQNDYALTMIARNVTTNGAAVTTNYTYNIPTDLMHNNGLFAVYNVGGTYTIDSLDFSSKTIKNSDVLVLADSKGDYNAATNYSFPSLLQSNYETSPSAGGFETTTEWELRAEEMIQLNPVSVIMCNPSNDLRTGVNTDSTKARYYRIERNFRNAGIQVYHSNGFWETGSTPSAWATYIEATRSADSIIYTYEASAGIFGTGVNGFLDGDNIHPTTAGHQLIYNTITQAFKLRNGKGLPVGNAATQYVQLSPSAAQSGFINIDGTGGMNKISNATTIGSGVATSSVATIALRVFTQSNSNVQIYGNGGVNKIFSSDNSNATNLPLVVYGSTLDFNVGSSGAIDALSLSSAGDATFAGKLFAGFNNPGVVNFRITGGTNHTMQYFYNGSRDNIFFANTGLSGGVAGTIAGDGLNLDNFTSGGAQTTIIALASTGITVTGLATVAGTTGNVFKWTAANGTPSNTVTPVGWVRVNVAGTDSWLPYYQ